MSSRDARKILRKASITNDLLNLGIPEKGTDPITLSYMEARLSGIAVDTTDLETTRQEVETIQIDVTSKQTQVTADALTVANARVAVLAAQVDVTSKQTDVTAKQTLVTADGLTVESSRVSIVAIKSAIDLIQTNITAQQASVNTSVDAVESDRQAVVAIKAAIDLVQTDITAQQAAITAQQTDISAKNTNVNQKATQVASDALAVESARIAVLAAQADVLQKSTAITAQAAQVGTNADLAQAAANLALGYRNQTIGSASQAEGFATTAVAAKDATLLAKTQTDTLKGETSGFRNEAAGFATTAGQSATSAGAAKDETLALKTQTDTLKGETLGFRNQAEGFANTASSSVTGLASKQNLLRQFNVVTLATDSLDNYKTEGRWQLDGGANAAFSAAITSPKTLVVAVARDTLTQTLMDEDGRMAVRHCYGFAGSGVSTVDFWSPWRKVIGGGRINATSELTNSTRRYNPNAVFGSGDYEFYNGNVPGTTFLPAFPDGTWWHVHRRVHETGNNGSGFWVHENWVELGASFQYERWYFDDGRGWSAFTKVWTERTLDFGAATQNALKISGMNDYHCRLATGQAGQITMVRDLTIPGPMSGGIPWAAINGGTMQIFDTSRADHAGVSFSTIGAASGDYTLASRQSIPLRTVGRLTISRWNLFFPVMPVAGEAYVSRFGFMDTPSNPTNGMYFEFRLDGSGFRCFAVVANAGTKTSVLLMDQLTMQQYILPVLRTIEVMVYQNTVNFHVPGIVIIGQSTGLPAPSTLRQALYTSAQTNSRTLGTEVFYQECITSPA